MTADVLDDPRMAGASGSARALTRGFPARPDLAEDLPLRFYIGAPHADWISFAKVPIFISYNTLRRAFGMRRTPKAPVAVDSGGFTQLTRHGRWTISAQRYAEDLVPISRVMRLGAAHFDFAAQQDWMCEPEIIKGGRLPSGENAIGSGLSVLEHQQRTVANLLELRALLGPYGLAEKVIPVLQGYAVDDYLAHIEQFAAAGVDLRSERLVGVGSVCRRQNTDEIRCLFRDLHRTGVRRLHGFGVSTSGLAQLAPFLTSADSMAWSLAARRQRQPIARDCHHRTCVTCPTYASAWRLAVIDRLRRPTSKRASAGRGHALLPAST